MSQARCIRPRQQDGTGDWQESLNNTRRYPRKPAPAPFSHKGQREKTGTNYISQINKPLEKAVLLCRQQQAYSPEHLCQSSSRVRRKAGGTHQENEIGNHSRESKLKASGPQSTHSGGLIFSVCGLLCGQKIDHIMLHRQKVKKAK